MHHTVFTVPELLVQRIVGFIQSSKKLIFVAILDIQNSLYKSMVGTLSSSEHNELRAKDQQQTS